ncbi:Nramp family divalent metal transporter [Maribacter sp. ANRC-HE7]|uniref:Nramp family divalent metal transporter n=1 Tax=Maribacter aquimaris TaxID=2737171 RepID=A0ABR7UYP3_9FLAO|nr:Nramp family divalent metal transporter [Maribacter aquimaris]MBD0777386.1 Nramp family divalent metal transporter [Maribacter aquimaris]
MGDKHKLGNTGYRSKLGAFKGKVALLVSSIAPGLFLLGYNIGTGSVTTMATSGAQYGLRLSWALLLSCVFTYFLIISFGKFTIVSGKTVLQSFRSRFGYGIAMFILLSLILSEFASCIGIMGVVTQIIQEWSRPYTSDGSGFHPMLIWLFFSAILVFLLWQGRYRFFEKVLAVFVGLMAASFLMTLFVTSPPPVDYLIGLIPTLPKENHTFLIISGMVGTTMGGVLYVVRSVLVSEKGWTLKDLKIEKRDAAISSGLMFILSLAVMGCAAGTLFPKGLHIENAIDMVKLMEPLAGKFASSIFVFGIVSAGLSSLFPILLLAPWLWSDFQGVKSNLKSPVSRGLIILGILISVTFPLFGGRPIFIMIASQSLAIMATPLILFLILILLNDKKIMGKYKFNIRQNITMILILLFTIYMAVVGYMGLFF